MTFLTEHTPPSDDRAARCEGPVELHLMEAAVMLAMAEWIFSQGAITVEIHPDGMHLRGFDVRGWLEVESFAKERDIGGTSAGGAYRCAFR